MGSIGYDEIDELRTPSSSSDSKDLFFSPEIGKNTIRLINKPHRFLCHWGFGRGKEICLKSSREDDTYCPLCDMDDKPPTTRYIIFILDRNDSDENGVSKVKVYEGGPTVFSRFRDYWENRGTNPGSSKEGPDFILKKQQDDPTNPFTIEYTVDPLDPTPLTEAEKNVVRQKMEEIDLSIFYQQKDVDELKEIASAKSFSSGDSPIENASPVSEDDFDIEEDDEDDDLNALQDYVDDEEETSSDLGF